VSHEKAVIAALEDPNPEVRLVAAAALGRIGGPAAEKALKKVADKEAKKKQEERDTELIKIANESAERARGRGQTR
jgi:HEAT repeat protein